MSTGSNEPRLGLLDRVTNPVNAVAGALTAFGSLATAFDPLKTWLHLPPWVVPSALFVLACLLLFSAFAGRSRLLRPERFRIHAEKPRFLKGRETEIEQLGALCKACVLSFLDGESGCGKSALVRAGLVPYCRNDKHLPLPLLIDLSAAPWEQGLSDLLGEELWNDPGQCCKELGYSQCPRGDSAFDVLAQVKERTTRVPLLIFDQFDDYQTLNRDRFYDGSTVRSVDDFLQSNSFWRKIAEGARKGQWHCLIVTRNDVRAGLDAVRFCDARTFSLLRVERAFIEPLFEEITRPEADGSPVIRDPQKGWNQLWDRLLADLTADERRVLPIQLAVALDALRRRRFLTLDQYKRDGRLPGLERLHIQGHIEDVASRTGLPVAALLSVLLCMTDAERRKTKRVSLSELRAAVKKELSGKLDQALQELVGARIVRRSVGEAPDECCFMLYHDYLARGVLEAHRFTDRWHFLLADRAHAWALAQGLREKWRGLLSLAEQGRLAWERLRGRMKYGTQRRYVLWSLARFLPIVLVAVSAGWIAYSVIVYRAHDELRTARGIVAVLDEDSALSENEAQHLSDLVCLGWPAREEAIGSALATENSSGRAAPHADMLAHLAVGLDPSGALSRELCEEYLKARVSTATGKMLSAASSIVQAIHIGNPSDMANLVCARLENSEVDSGTIECLGYTLAELAKDGLSPVAIESGTQAIVGRMEKRDVGSVDVVHLGSTLSALAQRTLLVPCQIERGAQAVLDQMVKPDASAYSLRNLGGTLAELAKSEPGCVALESGAQAILDQMLKSDVYDLDLALLGETLAELAEGKLDAACVKLGAQAIVDRMKKRDIDGYALTSLVGTLAKLVKNDWSLVDVESGAQAIVERMNTDDVDNDDLGLLGNALAELAKGKLDPACVKPGAQVIVDRMNQREVENGDLARLGDALAELAKGKLDSTCVRSGAQAIAERMKTDGVDNDAVGFLGNALAQLAQSTGDTAPISAIIQFIVDRMIKRDVKNGDLTFLGETLAELAKGKLDPACVKLGAQAIIGRMDEPGVGTYDLVGLGRALAKLAKTELGVVDVKSSAQVIVNAMETVEDAGWLLYLANCLSGLCESLAKEDRLALAKECALCLARPMLCDDEVEGEDAERCSDLLCEAEPQDLVDVLKAPMGANESVRRIILRALEVKTGQQFDGDLWKFVEWANSDGKTPRLNLD